MKENVQICDLNANIPKKFLRMLLSMPSERVRLRLKKKKKKKKNTKKKKLGG